MSNCKQYYFFRYFFRYFLDSEKEASGDFDDWMSDFESDYLDAMCNCYLTMLRDEYEYQTTEELFAASSAADFAASSAVYTAACYAARSAQVDKLLTYLK